MTMGDQVASGVGVGPRRIALPAERERRAALAPKLRRLLTPLLIGSVITVPLLVPRFGGNAVPPDLFNALFTVLGIIVFWRTRTRLRVPLGAAYFLVLAGGLLAITQTVEPSQAGLAILQDAYLFVWFVVMVNFLLNGSGRLVRIVAVVWSAVGVVMAFVVWGVTLPYPAKIPYLFDVAMVDPFGRSEATFRDPNMAGNFLVLSLFVLWASPRPRTVLVKLVLSVPFLLGIHATASITALATLAGGTLVALTISFLTRREAAVAATLLVLAAAVVVAALVPDDIMRGSTRVTGSLGKSEVFDESLGRSGTSLSLRAERWEEAFRLFGNNILLGIGPSTTDEALTALEAPLSGELHNDFVAGFLERGLLGGFGNLLLFFMVSWYCFRAVGNPALRKAGWRPAALFGCVVATLMSAISLETLHFRHVWLMFALVIGLCLLSVGESAPEAAARPARRIPTYGSAGDPGVGRPVHTAR